MGGGLLLLLAGCLSLESADLDQDGFVEDCNDQDARIHPDAADLLGDGLDTNCDGVDGRDADEDGAIDIASGGTDCDDSDPAVAPWAAEVCDGVDNNCDGLVDPGICSEESLPLASVAALQVTGEYLYSYTGIRSGSAGDVDADGVPDVLLGASLADYQGSDGGSIWLVSGATLAAAPQGLYSVETLAMLRIDGETASQVYGVGGLLPVGDVSGDGIDDLIVDARLDDLAGTNAGAVAFFWGEPGLASARPYTLDDAPLLLTGALGGERSGTLLSSGDIDGDGRPEVLVGASYSSTFGERAGTVYLLSGTATFWEDGGTYGLDAVAAAQLYGGPGDTVGDRGTLIGDLDGDGLSEVVLGAPGAAWDKQPGDSGVIYIFSGHAALLEGGLSWADADAVLWGRSQDERLGGADISTGGDITGDGRADLLLFAGDASPQVIHLLSAEDGLPQGEAHAAAFATLESGEVSATVAKILGDIDGDGRAELGVGTSQATLGTESETACTLVADYQPSTSHGLVSVFLGASLLGSRSLDDPERRLLGDVGSAAGQWLAPLGDLNLDGLDDFLVSGQQDLCWRGGSWLVYGTPL